MIGAGIFALQYFELYAFAGVLGFAVAFCVISARLHPRVDIAPAMAE